MNAMGTKVIVKTRVTFVLRGYGDLTLTDVALIWNKSATSYLAFGAMNAATEDHTMIPLENIALFDKYTYLPGGGLRVVNTRMGQPITAFSTLRSCRIFRVLRFILP